MAAGMNAFGPRSPESPALHGGHVDLNIELPHAGLLTGETNASTWSDRPATLRRQPDTSISSQVKVPV